MTAVTPAAPAAPKPAPKADTPTTATAADTPTTDASDTVNDAAVAEVKKIVDDENAKGYRGRVFDPYPNEAYSLLSGPDSPPVSSGVNVQIDGEHVDDPKP